MLGIYGVLEMKITEYKATTRYIFDNSEEDQRLAWEILDALDPLKEFEIPLQNGRETLTGRGV